jgi:hypothetical protein
MNVARRARPRPGAQEPERWSLDAGGAAMATLDIPPHATRDRLFDIHCAMTVRLREPLEGAWHRMTVLANGNQEWDRRVATHADSPTDGLEMHFRRRVPVGEGLKIVVKTDVRWAQRQSLVIEAEEG